MTKLFAGTNFSNAVLDRVNFGNANLQGAVFKNTVLSASTFDNAQLEDAVFEDTIIGYIDLQKLCRNTTISAEGIAELGCRWLQFILFFVFLSVLFSYCRLQFYINDFAKG